MEHNLGVTISELISELENLKIEYGDIEVTLLQESDNGDRNWDAHICAVEIDENKLGETIVSIY